MTDGAILDKIEPINKLLESRFGVRIAMDTFEHLVDVRQMYDEKRRLFLETMGEANALKNPDYHKAVLISEAVRIVLRELAPKRLKRKR